MSRNVLFRYPCNSSKLQFEIVCPKCAADVFILSPTCMVPSKLRCDVCGERFEPTKNDLWINIVKKEGADG